MTIIDFEAARGRRDAAHFEREVQTLIHVLGRNLPDTPEARNLLEQLNGLLEEIEDEIEAAEAIRA